MAHWELPPDAQAVAGSPLAHPELAAALFAATDVVTQCRVVLWAWHHDPTQAPLTAGRMAELAARYAMRLTATGVALFEQVTPSDATAFIHASTRKGQPPAVHTMHLRRTTVRAVHRTLHSFGLLTADPTSFVTLPSRWYRVARPLTDIELNQVRTAVMGRRGNPPPGAVVLAIAEAGASTAELTQLTWRDVTPTAIHLPGGARITARTVTPTAWGTQILSTAHTNRRSPAGALAISGSSHPPGSQAAQAAMTNRLRQLLKTAQLHTTPGVGPRSVRLWAAADAYRTTGSIQTAAAVLGMRSLDACAAAIGIA